jgi:decaprenyl-phosphate phosphoribosyltransferase
VHRVIWLRLLRPKQWSKNVLVLAAPGAAGVLGDADAIVDTAIAFVAFCAVASGTYCWNDALDVDEDRAHPIKARRPVAAGEITCTQAMVVGSALIGAGLAVSLVANWHLTAVVGGYAGLTLLYSALWKHVAVVDLVVIATGFLLRTIAGGVAVDVEISTWFLIVAGAGSLFMVTGKRHAEQVELGDGAGAHRASLDEYTTSYLAFVRAVATSVAILAYVLWAFEQSAGTGNELPFQLSIVPFVMGLLRYALLVEQGTGGAPEDVVMSDRTLQLIGAAWVLTFALGVSGH